MRVSFSTAQNSLCCNFAFGVGGSGRRPLESADPGLGVAVDVGKPRVEEGRLRRKEMKNIVVNIVRGAWGWKGLGV